MSEIKGGGPAFPLTETVISDKPFAPDHCGMTLRDYFAAKAMAAIIAMPDRVADGDYDEKTVATNAYMTADAMLKAREA